MIQSLKDLAEGVRGSQGTITVSRAQADFMGFPSDESLVVPCEALVEWCDSYVDPDTKAKKKKKAKDEGEETKKDK